MIDTLRSLRDLVRDQVGRILVGAAAVLLAVGVIALGSALFGGGQQAQDQAEQLAKELTIEVETAEDELAARHGELHADLSGVDAERVARDRPLARSLVLSLTGTSASTLSVDEVQQTLDAQYPALDADSRVLAEFVPQWMAHTPDGQVYTLAEADTEPAGVTELDYRYVTLARLDPVGSDQVRPEFVLLTWTTGPDGQVTDFSAQRVDARTRDRMLTENDRSATPGTPTPTGSTTPGVPEANTSSPPTPEPSTGRTPNR